MAQFPIDGFTSSLWYDTAVDAPHTDALTESLQADVVIIGAGITGLNAAIELAQNHVNVVVLEAGVIAGGASGRNGGQVNLGLNKGPDGLIDHYGEAAATPLIHAICRTPDTVFDRIRQLGIHCDAEQNGWIQGAVSLRGLDAMRAQADEYARYGLTIEELSKTEVEQQSGSSQFVGGVFVKQSGSIQPLSYTRELARVAQEAGVSIYTHSAVETLKRRPNNNGWVVSTPLASVTADQVLVCTNGYTGKTVSGLEKKVVPVRSIQVATEPLSKELQAKILPNRSTVVDKRRMILYGRYDRDNRLTMGDRGPMRDQFCEDDFADVKKRAIALYPELSDVRWDYHWGGRIAITKDYLPFLFEPARQLHVGMGYNGRGVGMGTMMGMAMAAKVLNLGPDKAFMPETSPDEFIFHALHEIGAEVVIRWEMLMDRLDSARG